MKKGIKICLYPVRPSSVVSPGEDAAIGKGEHATYRPAKPAPALGCKATSLGGIK